MRVILHNSDILSIEADAIALPVDGSAPGLEGNLARQLMKQLDVEEMHELYAPPPYYPFNGDCYWSSLECFPETHFQQICCLGFLSHTPGADPRAYMASAFRQMLDMGGCDPGFGQSIACPLLTGGRRIPPIDAAYIMGSVIDAAGDTFVDELHIAEKDPARFLMLQQAFGDYT